MKHSSAFWHCPLALLCLTIGFSISVLAQNVSIGDDVSRPIPGVGHDYVQGLSETVNPANGSLHIKIDLPVPKGRGFTLPFAITYDSGELYHFTTLLPGQGVYGPPLYGTSGYPTDRSQAGGGWSNTVPYATVQGFAVGNPLAPYYSDSAVMCPMSASYNFYDPNGGSHMLGLAAIGVAVVTESGEPLPSTACAGLKYDSVGYAYYTVGGDDQVFGQMDAACNGAYQGQGVIYPTDCNNAAPAFTATDLGGTVYSFLNNSVVTNVWSPTAPAFPSFIFPTQIEDRNGNIINFTSNGGVYGLPITDSLGRPLISAECNAVACSSPTPTSYTVGGLTYTLQYENIGSASFSVGNNPYFPINPIPAGNQCSFSNAVSYTNKQVLTSITLPNGQFYAFQYDSTYGLLNKITYPDGGWVQYTWGLSTGYSTLASFSSGLAAGGTIGTGLNGECNYRYQTPVITQRQVGYSAGSTAAQVQAFTLTTNWTGNTLWLTKNASVTTTDNITGNELITNYTYGYVQPWPGPNTAGQILPQIPVENTIQYVDGNSNVLKTVAKTWADQFEMTSEVTTLPNVGSYGVAYCYSVTNCSTSQNFPGVPVAKFEYDFGNVPSSMPPSLSTPGAASRTTTYAYYGITLPCHFTAPITFQTNPVPCPVTGYPPAAPDLPSYTSVPTTAQVVTYAGGATYNSSTYTWSGTRIAETDAYYDGQTSFGGGITATGGSTVTVPTGTHDETNYAPSSATPRGNPTTVIKWANAGTSPTVKYTFDETGQVLSKVDACGNASCGDVTGSNHTTTYSYTDSPSGGNTPGPSNAYVTQITYPTPADGVAQHETFSYSYSTGELASNTDRNSNETRYTYSDPLNRLTQTNSPDGGETTIVYNDSVPSITTSTLLNSSSVWETKVAIMDGMRHVTQTQLTDQDDGPDLVDIRYDGEGRVLTQSNPHRAATAPTDGTTTHSYESLGRPITLVHPDGTTQQWCYNDIVPATGIYCNTHQGSVTGTWVDFTDEKGNHWQRTSDSLGRLTEVMEPNGVAQTESMQTIYAYDALDNLLSVNQNGIVGTDTPRPTRTFTYDSLSRLIQAYNPESGWVCYGTTGGAAANGSNCTSGYDANGNLGAKTDARGVTISYTYDVQNRILGKTYSNNTTLPVSYSYDASSISGATNNVGRLASESVTNGSTLVAWRAPYAYDAMGRLQNEQQCTPANCAGTAYTPAYTYDLAGGVLTATAGLPSSVIGAPSSAMQFTYAYDTVHRLSSVLSNITQSANYPSILFEANSTSPVSYGPIGLMYAQSGVNSSTNTPALILTRTYDNRGRVLSETDEATAEQLTAATGSAGSITISGAEQSGTSGSATISINSMPGGPESGIITVTVKGIGIPVHWSEGTQGMSTSAMASLIASDMSGSTLVSATASGSQVILTSYLVGTGSDYSLSISQTISGGTQVSISAPSSLSGGASSGSTYDAGTASATINGNEASVSWGKGSTATSIASALALAIKTADSSFLTATVSGSVISLASTGTGAATDWTISAGAAYDTKNFTASSFSLSSSGMSGGNNATYEETNAYSYSIPSSGGYDSAGNLASVTDSATGQWSYSYDTLNRLLTGTATSGSYSGHNGCWAYDSFGNRTAENYQTAACPTPETQVTSTEPTAKYSINNQVTWTSVNGAVNGLTYDAAGNVLNDNLNSYLYDAEGRLCAVKNSTGTIIAYVYDAEGRRVGKGTLSSWPSACVAPTSANGFTLTTSYVLGPGGDQVSELSISGSTSTWVHTNIFAGGKLLGTYHDTNTYFALNDWLGTKRAEYTPNGLLSTFFSLPYGNGLSSSGNASDATEQHFTGKERDVESGNDYFGARYYASSMGRWMSPDPSPAGVIILSPQSWNLYNYVLNNPLRLVDRNGYWATGIHAQIVTYSLQNYVSAGELNELRARQYSMDADQSNQNTHAMANQGQSSQSALDGMWEFVSSKMNIVSQNLGSGGTLNSTGIDALGDAIHTVEDFTSPMHTDSNFMPYVWNGGFWPPSKWGPGVTHVDGEASPAQDWARIGFAMRLTMAALLQSGASCESGKRCLTAQNFESELDRNITDYVNSFYGAQQTLGGFPSGANQEQAEMARQCALGNRAACN